MRRSAVDMLNMRIIYIPGNGSRFHHTARNGAQLKTYELPISGIFHLIFFGIFQII